MDRCAQLRARGGWAEDRLLGRCTFPIAPLNTWSNLAYLVGGAVILFLRSDPASTVMAVALACLCIGSGLYHGFKTGFSNTLDWVGMYLVFGCLAVHGMAPLAPLTPWLMAVTGLLLASLFTYAIPKVSLDVQMGVLYWFSSLPIVLAGHWTRAAEILALFLLAYGCQVADRRGWTGRWGHAIWHVCSGLGITLIYLSQ